MIQDLDGNKKFTLNDLAEVTGLSINTLRYWVQKKRLQVERLHGRIYVDEKVFRDFLKKGNEK